jgi:hypothetical protein
MKVPIAVGELKIKKKCDFWRYSCFHVPYLIRNRFNWLLKRIGDLKVIAKRCRWSWNDQRLIRASTRVQYAFFWVKTENFSNFPF